MNHTMLDYVIQCKVGISCFLLGIYATLLYLNGDVLTNQRQLKIKLFSPNLIGQYVII